MPLTMHLLCKHDVKTWTLPSELTGYDTDMYAPAVRVDLTTDSGTVHTCTVASVFLRNSPQTTVLESLYHKGFELLTGTMYEYKRPACRYHIEPWCRGVFVKHTVKRGVQMCEFVVGGSSVCVPSSSLKVRTPFMGSSMGGQLGRGLCDNGLPEDCAGVVVRMLCVATKGPDRYPARP